jgi:hypothetical protein
MPNIKSYGTTDEETDIADRAKCRDIVLEILKFGVTQSQIVQIAYLLSLELENREDMVFLTKACKAVADGEINKSSTLIVTN